MYEGVQDEIIIFRYSAIRNRGKFATTVRLSPFGDLDFFDCCENIVRICRRSGCIMCGSLLVSRRECQRQRVIPFEGKRNGDLDSLKTAGKHGIPKVGTRNYLPRPTVFFFPRSGADNSLCSAGPTCAIRFPVLFSSTSEKLYR